MARNANPETVPLDRAEDRAELAGGLGRGVAAITEALRSLPAGPGVYRMSTANGEPLYVGKARNLKKRVAAYTRPFRLPVRLQRMIARTASLEVVTTHTEAEALLLESNMIKRLKPRYNIQLRDDKSFPYILLTAGHEAPQLVKHRGARNRKGEYFGPFASAGAVNQTLAILQRVFPLRSCSDSIYASRTRPCLQFQIKRCSAPCVGRIAPPDYQEIVVQARRFLAGNNHDLQQTLSRQMEAASDALEFETAAIYRDRIRALTQIQAHQDINIRNLGAADVVALHQEAGLSCIQVFFFRAGHNYGNRTYFPQHAKDRPVAEVMGAFLGQFYADKSPPPQVLVSDLPNGAPLLEEALAVRAGRRVAVVRPERGIKRKLVDNARNNARTALARRMSESASQRRLLEAVAELFGLDGAPERIEVYDNSHISGSNPVGAMIVAGPGGLIKGGYRKFNIKGAEIAPGDDYAMLRETLHRRFSRALKEDPDRSGESWPDLVIVDGGAGQLSTASAVLADLGIAEIPLVCIAKGPDRNAGRERFFMAGREPFTLPPGDQVLYFLQRLRDEAHRFVIGSHRARRSRDIGRSALDDIPGIGRQRKRSLLNHFGSAARVARAGLADLEAVEGISKSVARRVYEHFHTDG